ncbi:magnesium transporter [Anaerosalibacter sp. Marseille-P3206]|uniref:magnesium transporter n=1 Tax=Anaerosalibacter sp. Marseille-P3206 TaxID=1871005 RepID=UPI00098452A8|nr:magnesium transporter [Anaerosalibacter sp. Marseille-P3206]
MDQRILEQYLQDKKYRELRSELIDMREVDIAEFLEEIDITTALMLFRMLPKDLAVEVFSYFPSEKQKEIVGNITDKEIQFIVDEMYFDDMIDLLEEMPANVVKKILSNSSAEERKLINQFLNYPQDSAGSLMTIEYVDLKKKMTVKEALAHIKDIGLSKETVYTCYVTDKNRKLEGIVSLRKLVVGEEEELIKDIMEEDVVYVNTHDDQETVADVFRRYGFIALPVVDMEGRLTGIITVDDIVDVIDKESTEDFQKMAAMSPSEERYLDTSVFTLAKHRIIWLLFLMVSATFTGGIIKRYESVLESSVLLAAFIPMLMDTGGNAGSQSSTLVIRGLALGEIELKDAGKVIWKEFRISTIVGIILAIVNFARIYYFEKVNFLVAFTVSVTLVVTVVVSKMIGGLLPIIAKKMKIDPAIMAGPLITTIVDALSLTVYFTIASAILNI